MELGIRLREGEKRTGCVGLLSIVSDLKWGEKGEVKQYS